MPPLTGVVLGVTAAATRLARVEPSRETPRYSPVEPETKAGRGLPRSTGPLDATWTGRCGSTLTASNFCGAGRVASIRLSGLMSALATSIGAGRSTATGAGLGSGLGSALASITSSKRALANTDGAVFLVEAY